MSPTLRSALVACAFGIAAAAVFVVAVWTAPGQAIDQWLYNVSRGLAPVERIPGVASFDLISQPLVWLAVATLAVLLICGRRLASAWNPKVAMWSSIAMLAFLPTMAYGAGFLRDHVLPRPQLHDWIAQTSNSAPSGHAAAAAAFVVVLVRAAPPLLRLPLAVIGGTWAAVVDFGLVADGWHRPSDVIISTLLVVGCGLLLPDPWRGHESRAQSQWSAWLSGGVIIAAATVFAMSYYPSFAQLLTSTAIAAVIAGALVVADLAGRSSQTRPNTIDSVTSSNRWSMASR